MPEDILQSAQKATDEAAQTTPADLASSQDSKPIPQDNPPPQTDTTPTPALPQEPAPDPVLPKPPIEQQKTHAETDTATQNQAADQLISAILEPKIPANVTPAADTKAKPPQYAPPHKSKGISKILMAVIALLLLSLPVGVYFVSQQNQQLADIRSRAWGEQYSGTDLKDLCQAGNQQACDRLNQLITACRSSNESACTTLCGGSRPSGFHCVPPGTGCSGVQGMEYACTDWHWTNCIGGGTDGVGCGTGGDDDNGDDDDGPGLPTATPVIHSCTYLKIYKNGVQVTPSTLLPGDTVILAVKGNGNPERARFRVNGSAWTESTSSNNAGEFIRTYTVPTGVTDFVIDAEVFVDNAWK